MALLQNRRVRVDSERRAPPRAGTTMGKLERGLLTHFAGGPAELPPGLGTMTLSKLLERGWACKHPYEGSGPRLYAITESGRRALTIENQSAT